MEKLIPADTVDAYGNVWRTTGERQRSNIKEITEGDSPVVGVALRAWKRIE